MQDAVRRGKLSRAKCEGCGAEAAEAHHVDYQQPLKVSWLCKACHDEEHRRLSRAARAAARRIT